MVPYHSTIFHILNFSKKTLKRVLRENGFSRIKIENSWPTMADPYGVKKGIKGFKTSSFFIAQGVYLLSVCRLTLAPSIEVFAEND